MAAGGSSSVSRSVPPRLSAARRGVGGRRSVRRHRRHRNSRPRREGLIHDEAKRRRRQARRPPCQPAGDRDGGRFDIPVRASTRRQSDARRGSELRWQFHSSRRRGLRTAASREALGASASVRPRTPGGIKTTGDLHATGGFRASRQVGSRIDRAALLLVGLTWIGMLAMLRARKRRGLGIPGLSGWTQVRPAVSRARERIAPEERLDREDARVMVTSRCRRRRSASGCDD